jgi:glycerophosphoryl diester phosphodiesterase
VKTLGPVPVLWDRWRLEPGWTPRLHLSALLEAVHERTTLFLDLKGRHPRFPAALRGELDRHHPDRPVVVCSQSWDLLDALQPGSALALVYSIGNPRMLRDVWPRLARLPSPVVSIDQRLLSPETMRTFRERSVSVVTWTVNSAARMAELRAWGVDGIISDNFDLLRQISTTR